MTLHDVDRIYKGWAKMPPLRIAVMQIGAALGVKFPSLQPEKSKYMTAEEARVFMAQTGGKIDGMGPRYG